MRLFIAEKPSMGREISKYLPEQKYIEKRNGYIVQGNDVVTWAFGHILQQAEPGDYAEKYQRWQMGDLPIVPEEWKLLITKSSANQFEIIKELIAKADTIVNAGDPDREGQLLIDEILLYLDVKKPVQRILLNALDEKSIRTALQDLRNNEDFFNLRQSALARSRADWLMGMNLSRAYTLSARREGRKVTFPIGRVKTPTLALVVRRERELENFVPVDYFVLKVLYSHPNGNFWATWQPKEEQVGLDDQGRLLRREIAEALVTRLAAEPQGRIVKREKTKKKESQRLPLSLSALQVLAGKAYGYDPQQVLDTAQNLYEKKLTTYPRSDCDYLPENQFEDRLAIVKNLQHLPEERLALWAQHCDTHIRSRAWNDKKITAHHAIIPTTVVCPWAKLSRAEQHVYGLIAQAYLAQFYGEHEYEQTKITVQQEEELFVAHGRVVVKEGWKELYRKNRKADDGRNKQSTSESEDSDTGGNEEENNGDVSGELPVVKKGDTVQYKESDIGKKATKPPSRFTAATLLQAMKEIHKYVRNEELKKQLKDVAGIGTEATRATIISELISRDFLKETGKKKILQPTELAYMLVDALPEEMLYPDETAVWEERLAQMSEGKDTLEAFLTDQVAFLERLIAKEKAKVGAGVRETGGETCPSCGKGQLRQRKGKFGLFWGCSNFPACKYTAPVGDRPLTDVTQVVKKKGTSSNGDAEPMVNITQTVGRAGRQGETGRGQQMPRELEKPYTAIQGADGAMTYPCPRCKSGHFVPKPSGNGWQCSNSPKCRTQCADVDGKPSIYR